MSEADLTFCTGMGLTAHRRQIMEDAVPRLRQIAALERLAAASHDAQKESVSNLISYAAAHERQAAELEAALMANSG